jgi:putative transposase
MIVGTKLRLYPTKEQELLFFKFCNTARFIYNESLAYKIKLYKEQDYSCRTQDLISHIQDLKSRDDYFWINETPLSVYRQVIMDLDNAYSNFFKRGNKGFPKFKSKKNSKLSFFQRVDNLHMIDGSHIKITGIKTPVKVKEPLLNTHIYNPRVSFDGKFWYLSYSYAINESEPKIEGKIIGVDLGIKDLAVCSDGIVYPNINKTKRVKQLEKRKRHLQRKISGKYLMNKEGNKYVKTNNIKKLEHQVKMIDRTLKNIRDTYMHQVTCGIVSRAKTVCIEDLNVSGMMKNKHMRKALQQQELYKFRQYITYKSKAYGVALVVADRFYPSTKIINCCGYKLKFVSLSQRILTCPICGKTIDRDYNAALNLRDYALAQ